MSNESNKPRTDAPTVPDRSHDHVAGSADRSGSSFWKSVWFVIKAVEIRLRFIAILVAVGLVIGYWGTIRNYWDKWTRPATTLAADLEAGEEFFCPMHPEVVRNELDPDGQIPKCPICGMPLSKRKVGAPSPLPAGVLHRVQLSPYRVQLAGIRTIPVAHRDLAVEVRTVGYVVLNERNVTRIVSRVGGYIEKLYVNESFSSVQPGEPLAEIYSPELYSAAQELLLHRRNPSSPLAEIARQKLRLLGVDNREIEQILENGQASWHMTLRAPRGGHIFQKEVFEGDRIEAGQMLFEVADLSTVWIEGEVFEADAAAIRPGQEALATLTSLPGEVFQGRVALVHPHVEPRTRTLRVRLELENRNHRLRPGMYATVRMRSDVRSIEPFASQWAAEQAARVPPPTAEVAATRDSSADSHVAHEQLIAQQEICPVTGNKLGSMGKPVRTVADGRNLFLCCAACEKDVAGQPDYYANRVAKVTDAGVIAVPASAVVDTGTQKVVYVEREAGVFDAVAVTLGPRSGNYYAVIDGLLPGDRVASAGAFLLDAETRLNPSASAAYFGAGSGPNTNSSSTPESNHRHAP